MTPSELDRIKQRHSQATKGVWCTQFASEYQTLIKSGEGNNVIGMFFDGTDAEAVVQQHADIAALLEYIERLEEHARNVRDDARVKGDALNYARRWMGDNK